MLRKFAVLSVLAIATVISVPAFARDKGNDIKLIIDLDGNRSGRSNYHDRHYDNHRHHVSYQNVWVPGYWERGRYGRSHWVSGHWEKQPYRYGWKNRGGSRHYAYGYR